MFYLVPGLTSCRLVLAIRCYAHFGGPLQASWISSTPAQGNESAAVPFNRNGSSVPLRGDMHYYDMVDDFSINCWDAAEIAPRARFVTETGWISWPSFLTMAPTLDPRDYGFNGSVAGARVEHPPAQRECTHQVNLNWRWPDRHPSTSAAGYRDELWMTQVAASQCLVASIEFWRSTESELVNTTYGTFRLNFHHFDCFELDLRGHSHVRDHSHVRGAALSCLRLKLANMVLI